MKVDNLTPEDLGFKSAIEFCIYNWLKLTKEDREQLRSVGITPEKDNEVS